MGMQLDFEAKYSFFHFIYLGTASSAKIMSSASTSMNQIGSSPESDSCTSYKLRTNSHHNLPMSEEREVTKKEKEKEKKMMTVSRRKTKKMKMKSTLKWSP